MRELVAIGLGGFLGALGRHALTWAVARRFESTLPFGTFAVNVLGCFVLGLVAAWFRSREGLAPATRLFLTVGVLGSFTTFSTFGLETLSLLRAGDWARALGYALASVVLGVAAAAAGLALGERAL